MKRIHPIWLGFWKSVAIGFILFVSLILVSAIMFGCASGPKLSAKGKHQLKESGFGHNKCNWL